MDKLHPTLEACRKSLNATGEFDLPRSINTHDILELRNLQLELNELNSKRAKNPDYKMTATDQCAVQKAFYVTQRLEQLTMTFFKRLPGE